MPMHHTRLIPRLLRQSNGLEWRASNTGLVLETRTLPTVSCSREHNQLQGIPLATRPRPMRSSVTVRRSWGIDEVREN